MLTSNLLQKNNASSRTAPTHDDCDFSMSGWPVLSLQARPGILGDFVELATAESEADPAAVVITTLVRFAAEIYGFAEGKGPHMYVGETVHPPRLFAVICGNSSKARKGTSRYPVAKLFSREHCQYSLIKSFSLPEPARESGGPLSTGEGLANQVREESLEEYERKCKSQPNEPFRGQDDKRLMIIDEEFAAALACTKREGNTLSMAIRSFWDSGNYAPLTKNNPVVVKNAHINIVTHITAFELAIALENVQVVNGFGNRFLWICAKRSKLVPMPRQMAITELAVIQQEIWKIIGHAQKSGVMTLTPDALEYWTAMYPKLSKEHFGLAGSIINRAEAQALRLSMIYALLDGHANIQHRHLRSAFAMWQYAKDSALYLFGNINADPIEEKILNALREHPLSATELSKALGNNVNQNRLKPLLRQLESQNRIMIMEIINPKTNRKLTMFALNRTSNEKNEFYEII